MSQTNDEQKSGSGKKGRRGSVNNQNRLDVFKETHKIDGADWGACESARIADVVVLITNMGGAVTFGMSRNQGAYSLSIMLDGHRETLWFNGSVDLDEELANVRQKLDAMG